MGKISPACKAAAKRKFEVWPSAYASGWGVRCTKAGGPGKMGKKKKKVKQSNGQEVIKLRNLTKPPMVMKDKTKYDRKQKHKKANLDG